MFQQETEQSERMKANSLSPIRKRNSLPKGPRESQGLAASQSNRSDKHLVLDPLSWEGGSKEGDKNSIFSGGHTGGGAILRGSGGGVIHTASTLPTFRQGQVRPL